MITLRGFVMGPRFRLLDARAQGLRRIATIAAAVAGLSFSHASKGSDASSFALGPPQPAPVVVNAQFDLTSLSSIQEEMDAFEFEGVMTLSWRDPRQAFDPATVGVHEKVFQGGYQFDEISPGWFPQIMLVNSAGSLETTGVTLRIRSDGSCILLHAVHGSARAGLDLRRFPFDHQRLRAVFEVLGFGASEVQLRAPSGGGAVSIESVTIPQWEVTGAQLIARERSSRSVGPTGVAASIALEIQVTRQSFHVIRLIVLPLMVIVTLSFTVFWMDRSSVGDRLAVSFIGILTGVAYQLVIADLLPRISYFTLIHGFLNLSFFTMAATVVINLRVATHDRRGHMQAGDRLDRRCRWLFPSVYLLLLAVMTLIAMTVMRPSQ